MVPGEISWIVIYTDLFFIPIFSPSSDCRDFVTGTAKLDLFWLCFSCAVAIFAVFFDLFRNYYAVKSPEKIINKVKIP